jgi:hypothetical protein
MRWRVRTYDNDVRRRREVVWWLAVTQSAPAHLRKRGEGEGQLNL